MIIKRKQTGDAQCNYSPPTDQPQTPLPKPRSAVLRVTPCSGLRQIWEKTSEWGSRKPIQVVPSLTGSGKYLCGEKGKNPVYLIGKALSSTKMSNN